MKNRLGWQVIVIVLAVTMLTACGGTTPLEDKEWILESHNDNGNVREVLNGSEITATFDSAEKVVSGTAGCNHYFGDYEVDGNRLSLSSVGSTEMACMEPQGVMEQEQRYLNTLLAAESYQISGEQLQITAGNDVLTFRVK